MSQKRTIHEVGLDEYPNTQLQYEVRDETGDVLLLRDALYDVMEAKVILRRAIDAVALDYIQFGMQPEKDVLKLITAALEAAKGE